MKTIIALFLLGLALGAASAQTTTYTGTIKDLQQNVVTSGQVTFTLTPSVDSTIPGIGRFTPSVTACPIGSDGTLSNCSVTMNTALSPAGTSYKICIQAYFASPGSCFYDYATTSTKDISTVAPTLQTGPLNYNGIPGPPGCVMGSTCTSALTPVTVNGVASADQFAGADMGAKITAAFGSGQGEVTTPPGQKFNYATTWEFPTVAENGYPILDCQGSELHYTGSGWAGDVPPGLADPYQSGHIRNCVITGTSAALGGIHVRARVGLKIDVSGSGFTSGSLVEMENTTFNGTPPNGWNERAGINVSSFNNAFGVRLLGSRGGTNSFAYGDIAVRCQVSDGQWCVSVEGNGGLNSADLYAATLSIKGNGGFVSAPGGLLRAVSGANIRGSGGVIDGEAAGAGYAIYNDITSNIDLCARVFPNNLTFSNAGTSNQQNVGPLAVSCGNGSFSYQPPAFSNGGVQQATNWQMRGNPNGMEFSFPSYGGNGTFGRFGLFRKATSPSDPEAQGTGRISTFYADGNPNIGIGPNFDTTHLPAHTVDIHGDMAVTNPNVGTDGTTAARQIGSDGTVYDTLHSITTGGQPSQNYVLQMYDAISLATVDTLHCNVGNTGFCEVMGDLQLASVAAVPCTGTHKTGTSAGGGEFNYVAGATGAKDTVQVCAKDATNAWAWRAIY